jgi:tetratricopeptide (TPR) repeat protein
MIVMSRLAKSITLAILSLCAIGQLAAADLKKDQRKLDYFFYEGLNQKSAGNYSAAFDLFNYCLDIDSTSSPVLYELSLFYANMNRPEKAVSMLDKAVANAPDNYTYRMALASMQRGMGMFGEAVEQYEKLVKDNPDKPELNYYLADALTQQGEIGKAIDAYNVLENAIGMNEALSFQKFKLYSSLEKEDKAFGEIEKLAAKFPMSSRYLIMLGDLHLEKDDTVKALKYYTKAHEIDPSTPYYTVSMANYYETVGDTEAAEREIKNALVNDKLDIDTKVGILSRYVMRLQQNKKDLDGANQFFQSLIEQHPEDIELKQMYGNLLLAQDKTEEARFQFQLITEMEPLNDSAWKQLLNLALKSEDIPEVIRICKRCQELFPNAPEYDFYLGVSYYQQELYDLALKAYQDGADKIPAENTEMKSDFIGQIGDIYYQMGNMPKAYEAYEEALKYNDKNVMVLNNYAYFLSLDKKDLKKAERMSAMAVKLEPDNSTYLDTYAWIFFVQGNYTLAKIYIRSAVDKDKTNSTALLDHYGDILFMTGDTEGAVEQWKKAKEAGMESETLDKKIAEQKYIEEEKTND